MNFLLEILKKKRARVDVAKQQVSLEVVRANAESVRASARPHAFTNALTNDAINIIAEFKRKSPSKGPIRPNANPTEIANAYRDGGAAAISVLTEEDYFDGSLDDLRAIKIAVKLPVLRKDFVGDEYQVYEAASAGADAVLLIVAALEDRVLERLLELAENELQMDALVEVHTSQEMKRAKDLGAHLIGVNNRDLHTFQVSLETSIKLAGEAPDGSILISESGLETNDDLRRLKEVGYSGFLIGESLMKSEDPAASLLALLQKGSKGADDAR
ncbi:MAG TPA: indole-3-glycerol phosphate synthase TrpC [Pyrinomonadaceae bacterium]|nr:indole-3-glycerol phosphate synthase TrpC [Pyrinomonadaceae bacterium]